ncbi:MAG: hypothetical protein NTX47_00305 [Candidatus Omnitrophica bacterium]|nr:hypothetical protein [Candidatus Omnitrophota bacterium]
MGFSFFYTIFFGVTWILVIPVILKVIPVGAELICIFAYSIIGIALYFLIPNLITAYLEDQQEIKHQKRNSKVETKKKFLDEQRLMKQYRYLKLNKKESIITSNIDKKDKISLLEIVHGYTPEAALQMIKEYEDKKGVA